MLEFAKPPLQKRLELAAETAREYAAGAEFHAKADFERIAFQLDAAAKVVVKTPKGTLWMHRF